MNKNRSILSNLEHEIRKANNQMQKTIKTDQPLLQIDISDDANTFKNSVKVYPDCPFHAYVALDDKISPLELTFSYQPQ
jgi:hypothetical protein